jgi:hypothetical protein
VKGPTGEIQTKVTYGEPICDLAFPAEVNMIVIRYDDKPTQPKHIHVVLNVIKTSKTPESFRLSEFGLPEPVEFPLSEKHIPIYVWFLAAAGGCAIVACGFRYLARRRRPIAIA